MGGTLTLLDKTTITTAVTGVTTPGVPIGTYISEHHAVYLAVRAAFTYGSGGTNTTVYVQTSLDEGVTWIDIMSFQFTTSTATKISAVSTAVALAAAVTGTDGSLTVNTILNGLLGDRVRLKYTTTGTYGGGTTLGVTGVIR
jgi:hypothetical protein